MEKVVWKFIELITNIFQAFIKKVQQATRWLVGEYYWFYDFNGNRKKWQSDVFTLLYMIMSGSCQTLNNIPLHSINQMHLIRMYSLTPSGYSIWATDNWFCISFE